MSPEDNLIDLRLVVAWGITPQADKVSHVAPHPRTNPLKVSFPFKVQEKELNNLLVPDVPIFVLQRRQFFVGDLHIEVFALPFSRFIRNWQNYEKLCISQLIFSH